VLASFVKLRNPVSREVKGRSWEETTLGKEFPTGNLKSIHVLRAKVREGPGDRDHSSWSEEGCVSLHLHPYYLELYLRMAGIQH
jgi:hypothetical protein